MDCGWIAERFDSFHTNCVQLNPYHYIDTNFIKSKLRNLFFTWNAVKTFCAQCMPRTRNSKLFICVLNVKINCNLEKKKQKINRKEINNQFVLRICGLSFLVVYISFSVRCSCQYSVLQMNYLL